MEIGRLALILEEAGPDRALEYDLAYCLAYDLELGQEFGWEHDQEYGWQCGLNYDWQDAQVHAQKHAQGCEHENAHEDGYELAQHASHASSASALPWQSDARPSAPSDAAPSPYASRDGISPVIADVQPQNFLLSRDCRHFSYGSLATSHCPP